MKKYHLALIIVLLLSAKSYAQSSEEFILNENFDRNKMGWAEEYTSSHYTGIKEGFLYIVSKDTTKERTSNGPQNVAFLWDMPEEYEITTSAERLKSFNDTRYGIILSSATLTYKFSYSESGMAELTEYDANKEEELYVFSKKISNTEKTNTAAVNLKITVAGRLYTFYINNQKAGSGEFSAKSWEGIRLFVTSGSAAKFDYLRIKKIK